MMTIILIAAGELEQIDAIDSSGEDYVDEYDDGYDDAEEDFEPVVEYTEPYDEDNPDYSIPTPTPSAGFVGGDATPTPSAGFVGGDATPTSTYGTIWATPTPSAGFVGGDATPTPSAGFVGGDATPTSTYGTIWATPTPTSSAGFVGGDATPTSTYGTIWATPTSSAGFVGGDSTPSPAMVGDYATPTPSVGFVGSTTPTSSSVGTDTPYPSYDIPSVNYTPTSSVGFVGGDSTPSPALVGDYATPTPSAGFVGGDATPTSTHGTIWTTPTPSAGFVGGTPTSSIYTVPDININSTPTPTPSVGFVGGDIFPSPTPYMAFETPDAGYATPYVVSSPSPSPTDGINAINTPESEPDVLPPPVGSFITPSSTTLDGLVGDTTPTPSADNVYCTQDVFTCPDGSYVSRDPSNNCEFPPCGFNHGEYESRKDAWNDAGLMNYTFKFRWSCFCTVEMTRWVTISVVNGEIDNIVADDTGESIDNDAIHGQKYYSMSGLFTFIDDKLAENPSVLSVDFDSTEYISSAYTDMDPDIIDEELGFEVTDFISN